MTYKLKNIEKISYVEITLDNEQEFRRYSDGSWYEVLLYEDTPDSVYATYEEPIFDSEEVEDLEKFYQEYIKRN